MTPNPFAKDNLICHLNEQIKALTAERDKYKALCDQMANSLDQLTFAMDLRLDDGDLSLETRDAFSALDKYREMK